MLCPGDARCNLHSPCMCHADIPGHAMPRKKPACLRRVCNEACTAAFTAQHPPAYTHWFIRPTACCSFLSHGLFGQVGHVLQSSPFLMCACLCSPCRDGTLRLWDLNTGVTTRRFVGHTKVRPAAVLVGFDQRLIGMFSPIRFVRVAARLRHFTNPGLLYCPP